MPFPRRRNKEYRPYALFHFASEGEKTEHEYLEQLQRIYDGIRFAQIPTSQHDPKNLLQAMQHYEHVKKGTIRPDDKCIILVDRDKWPARDMEILWQWEREDSRHMLLVSNPCFELWLLRHFESGEGASTAVICHNRLKMHNNQTLAQKSVPKGTFTREDIRTACVHAKASPTRNWKEPGFTNMYRLIDAIEALERA